MTPGQWAAVGILAALALLIFWAEVSDQAHRDRQ